MVVASNNYYNITINNFQKLLDLDNVENISPIITPIFIAIFINIWPTKFLKNTSRNIKYNLNMTIYEKFVII